MSVSKTVSCSECDWEKEIEAETQEKAEQKANRSLKGHEAHCDGTSPDKKKGNGGQKDKSDTSSLPIPDLPLKIWLIILVVIGAFLKFNQKSSKPQDQEEEGVEDTEETENQETSTQGMKSPSDKVPR